MDYKEKYERSIEKAQKMQENSNGMILKKWLWAVFPELAESEDERIRKELIENFKWFCGDYPETTKWGQDDNLLVKDIIAWLEKQSNKKQVEHLELKAGHWYICHRPYCCRADNLTVKEGEKFQCENDGVVKGFVIKEPEKYFMEINTPKDGLNDEVRRISTIQVLEYAKSLDVYNQYGKEDIDKNIAWLEKQGKQETLCDKCKKEHPSHSCQDITELGRCAVEHERKPTDKTTPKFKPGDLITNDYCLGKVIEITNDAYLLDTGQGIPFSCEHNAHLWTIEDAKDGDVLAAQECYVIFKEIDGLNIKCHCTYHYMGFTPSFHINTLQNKAAFHPATKEQCDTLFAKMKEAGYEWDSENKELKKVKYKFNVDDWIVTDDSFGKIVRHVDEISDNIIDKRYVVSDENGLIYNISFDKEHKWHKWTIKDAEDGDVLATENFIFIFKNIDNGNGVHYYCQYKISKHEDDNQFDIALPQSLMGRVGNSISYYSPATKEQCDILFTKMKEAGYKWDSEKKELKKIEPKILGADDILPYLGNNQVQDILEDMGMLDDNGRCPHTAEEIFKAGMEHAFNLNREDASSVKFDAKNR